MTRISIDVGQVKLLRLIRANARLSVAALGRLLRVPASTVYDNYLRLRPVIRRHSSLVDFQGLGYNCCAFIKCNVPASQRLALYEYLRGHPVVNSARVVNDRSGLLVEVVERNPARVSLFVEELEEKFGVRDAVTHFIAEEFAREAFLS